MCEAARSFQWPTTSTSQLITKLYNKTDNGISSLLLLWLCLVPCWVLVGRGVVYCSLPLGSNHSRQLLSQAWPEAPSIWCCGWLILVRNSKTNHLPRGMSAGVVQRYGLSIQCSKWPTLDLYLIASHALHFESTVIIYFKVAVCWRHCSPYSHLQQTNIRLPKTNKKQAP